jgi:hypothetical protein
MTYIWLSKKNDLYIMYRCSENDLLSLKRGVGVGPLSFLSLCFFFYYFFFSFYISFSFFFLFFIHIFIKYFCLFPFSFLPFSFLFIFPF